MGQSKMAIIPSKKTIGVIAWNLPHKKEGVTERIGGMPQSDRGRVEKKGMGKKGPDPFAGNCHNAIAIGRP